MTPPISQLNVTNSIRHYLPAFSIGYLGMEYEPVSIYFLELGQTELYVLAIISLITGSYLHGMKFSAVGPPPHDNTEIYANFSERVMMLFWEDGIDEDFSLKKLGDESASLDDIPLDRRGKFLLGSGIISSFFWGLSVILAIYGLALNFRNLDVLGGALILSLIVISVRPIMWRIFRAVFYKLEHQKSENILTVYDALDQMVFAIQDKNGLDVGEVNYNIQHGGIVTFRYQSDHEFENLSVAEFEVVVLASYPFIRKTDFPVEKIRVIFEKPNVRGNYEIRGKWVREAINDDISNNQLVNRVFDTLEIESESN